MHKFLKIVNKSLAALTLSALIVSSIGLSFASPARAEGTVKVTILKYIDGVKATAVSATSSDFQMNATWVINAVPGTGTYNLSAAGYNGDPTPYQAIGADLPIGTDYATDEIIDNVIVGATYSSTTLFTLAGYSVGDTLDDVLAATSSLTAPSFSNLQNDKFIIVWNTTNVAPIVPVIPTATTTVKVTIAKYINGVPATASSSFGVDFPMSATWDATNVASGTGEYSLSALGYNGNPVPYQAETVAMDSGADYATNEITGGQIVGPSCSGDQPFKLMGYTSGDTMALAASGTLSEVIPTFIHMTSDKFVIVWNKTCSNYDGQIGGEVIDGTPTTTVGILKVTSIDTVNNTAKADGTFTNGWKYSFNITVPTNETHLSMKFADWTSVVGSSTIPAANNIRFSSTQADNGAAIMITAANTYPTGSLHITSDLDPSLDGLQVKVMVETAVPAGSVNGSYTTNYGVKTL